MKTLKGDEGEDINPGKVKAKIEMEKIDGYSTTMAVVVVIVVMLNRNSSALENNESMIRIAEWLLIIERRRAEAPVQMHLQRSWRRGQSHRAHMDSDEKIM